MYVAVEVRAFLDAFPVSPGHALIVPRRHVASWFDLTESERAALLGAVDAIRPLLVLDRPVDGWNIGVNVGSAAGQTVPHVHLHVIPRYHGDVPDPRGGVRFVVPERANYLAAKPPEGLPHAEPLIRGSGAIDGASDDPLLPHLLGTLAHASEVNIAVAFTLASGVQLVEEHLRDVLSRGGRVRFLTGDYLAVTEPEALLRLLDLGERLELRVFESGYTSFHLKTYICRDPSGFGTAYVGSSNLSRTALKDGIEWNWRVVTTRDAIGFDRAVHAFERLYSDPRSVRVDPDWVTQYRARRGRRIVPDTIVPFELPLAVPRPHEVQEEALGALASTRSEGNAAGLVVLATGLGKTWLAAFDTMRAGARRVLFVAHRDEILDQAVRTFRAIRPGAVLGKYTGTEKTRDADVVFASVQTLGRRAHLERFPADEFDYVIVDEFHHAAAATYRRLLEHFSPTFLLGLTATPERTDGADLLALCGENLVYRCDLVAGIRRGLLSPFDYFGVPDDVDYQNIPWRNGRFDENELTNRLAVGSRANNALEQWRRRGGTRTLAFCVSQRHADFMYTHFSAAGVRAAAVHSGATSAPRAESLERLQAGDLEVLFAVDMFNEGVDLPDVDTVLMLRPTESAVLWLQQFGRGLRRREGKRLKVVDYIGNHRSFLVKPRTLFQLSASGDAELAAALRMEDDEIRRRFLPPGCSVTYELEAKALLQGLADSRVQPADRLETYYRDFRDRLGTRPTASEAFHDGYDPKAARAGHGSWFQFVRQMGDFDRAHDGAESQLRDFLQTLEITPMVRSYKMLVLLALLAERQLPGSLSITQLVARVRTIARRSAVLRADVGDALDDDGALRTLLEDNPIRAWRDGRGTGGRSYFSYTNEILTTTFTVPADLKEAAADVVGELAEWRLSQYLTRQPGAGGADRILCKVSHAGDRPILFLPPRERTPGIPEGWVDVKVDGTPYQAKFAQVAVNVLHAPGSEENQLPSVLRAWYGEDAGQPGSAQMAVFERAVEGYTLSPIRSDSSALTQGLRRWAKYPRLEAARSLGVELKGFEAQSGVVDRPGMLLLFVTLDKSGKPEAHRYKDAFLNPDAFRWQSQNRNRRDSRIGKMISQQTDPPTDVHLFVRATAKSRSGTESFLYCGPLRFERWEGDNPITVWWRLSESVPEAHRTYLRIPDQ
jgi:superfamily II DNA or RNA helicase/HKD family nuclease/diadenosine tetraphosphate (Ap4A) HIT family hydrolase